jgi:hypothetical protein
MPHDRGDSPLVWAEHSFGTFAMLPDHIALGVRAAGMVFERSENDREIAEPGVQFPLRR